MVISGAVCLVSGVGSGDAVEHVVHFGVLDYVREQSGVLGVFQEMIRVGAFAWQMAGHKDVRRSVIAVAVPEMPRIRNGLLGSIRTSEARYI